MKFNPVLWIVKASTSQPFRIQPNNIRDHNKTENLIFYLKLIQMTLEEIILKYKNEKSELELKLKDTPVNEIAHFFYKDELITISLFLLDLEKIE
jgi:hypothetical protein